MVPPYIDTTDVRRTILPRLFLPKGVASVATPPSRSDVALGFPSPATTGAVTEFAATPAPFASEATAAMAAVFSAALSTTASFTRATTSSCLCSCDDRGYTTEISPTSIPLWFAWYEM